MDWKYLQKKGAYLQLKMAHKMAADTSVVSVKEHSDTITSNEFHKWLLEWNFYSLKEFLDKKC